MSSSPEQPSIESLPSSLQQIERWDDLQAWDERVGSLPWGDPAFSERMLREHLSQEHDLASRRQPVILEQVDWLDARLAPGSSVLDGGCGAGLHALDLVGRGYAVTGVDLGPAVIRHGRAEAERRGLPVHFELADLRELELSQRFDAILLLYGQFHTFAPDEASRLLATLHRHLRPAGRLMLELRAPTHWDRSSYRNWWAAAGGLFGDGPHLVLYEHLWDEATEAEVEGYQILHGNGALQTFQITERFLDDTAIRDLLHEAGFQTVTGHDDWPSEKAGAWVMVEATA